MKKIKITRQQKKALEAIIKSWTEEKGQPEDCPLCDAVFGSCLKCPYGQYHGMVCCDGGEIMDRYWNHKITYRAIVNEAKRLLKAGGY